MPHWTVVGETNGTGGTGAVSPNISGISGIADGDLVLIFIETANQSITAPTNWTKKYEFGTGTAGGASATRVTLLSRTYLSSGWANPTVADPGDHQVMNGVAFRGARAGDPFPTGHTAQGSGTGTTFTLPGITTTEPNMYVFQCLAVSSTAVGITGGSTALNSANASLADYVVRANDGIADGNTGFIFCWAGVKTIAGAVDAVEHTLTGSATWAAFTFAVRATGVGALAATEAADTAALAGDVLIEGALAAAEPADTAAVAGDVIVRGTLAASEGSDTAALAGGVPVQGALAVSEGAADTAAAVGAVPVNGTLAALEGGDTTSVAGIVPVHGALTVSEAADAAASTGNVPVNGSLALAEGADTAAIAGLVPVRGALDAAETGDTAAMSGGSIPIIGTLVAAEGQDTAALSGMVAIRGAFLASEAADSASIAGLVPAQGILAATEPVDVAAFAGDVIDPVAPPAPETSPERILTLYGHSRTVTVPRLSIRSLRPAPIGRRLPVPQLVRTVVCDATPPRVLAVPRDNPRQVIA